MLSISPNHPLGHWCHLFHFSTCCHLPIHCSYYFKQTVTWLRIKKIKAFALPLFIPSLSLCHISNLHHLPSSWRPFSFSLLTFLTYLLGFPGSSSGKEPACQCRRRKKCRFDPWVRKIPWRRAWQPTPVFLPGESPGQRTLVGYSHKELDMTGVTQHAHTILMPEPSCSVPYIHGPRKPL